MSISNSKPLVQNLIGKTVLITGSNDGMGFQTALSLAYRRARIIMADKRDNSKSKSTIIEMSKNENISTYLLDLCSLKSVRNFAEKIKNNEEKLDILINNAGVFCLGNQKTEEGLHPTMAVNHFGPFLLTHLLIDLLKKSAPSRIIFVSSVGAFIHTLTLKTLNDPKILPIDILMSNFTYYNSKLCNMIVANTFAEKLRKYSVTCNSLHPGMTRTKFLFKSEDMNPFVRCTKPLTVEILKFFTKEVYDGALTAIFLATSNSVENVTGQYFDNCLPHRQPLITENKKFCESIWKASEDLVKLQPKDRI